MKSAVLLHVVDWCSEEADFQLTDDIYLCRSQGSDVERLYCNLCETQNMDQGDPFNFSSHILLLEGAHNNLFPYWRGPFSVISRVCNLITVCTSLPLGMCRLILTHDDFRTVGLPSEVIYDENPNLDMLRAGPNDIEIPNNNSAIIKGEHFQKLDDCTLKNIRKCWGNLCKLAASSDVDNHRVSNASSYFFYSWRSYSLEHMCLNLAIVLESLFSPSSGQELSHQIAFNVSGFFGGTSKERKAMYQIIKDFYGLRSKIIHGGKPKFRDIYTLIPVTFHLCAGILKDILEDCALASCFCEEKKRQTLFDKWLFDHRT